MLAELSLAAGGTVGVEHCFPGEAFRQSAIPHTELFADSPASRSRSGSRARHTLMGTICNRRTTSARPRTSSGTRGSSGGPARWLGASTRSKKNTLIAVKMRPLSGI